MNEQLQQTINDILTKSAVALEHGGEWLAGEIPDVVSQLLIWNAVSSFLMMIFGLLMLTPNYKIFKAVIKESDKDWRECSDAVVVVGSVYLCFGSFVGIAIFLSNFDWLKIWVAPKLYLLEYAADLIK